MRKLSTPGILTLIGMLLCLSSAVFSQNPRTTDVRAADPVQAGQRGIGGRPNLLQELGLTPDQIQNVRRINQERKPVEQAARLRFQNAQRDLNAAIYSDSVSERDVKAKLAEFQAAQADLARIKFTNELAVRNVLTQDQLVRFRELRRRFAEAREKRQEMQPARTRQRRFRRGGPPVN